MGEDRGKRLTLEERRIDELTSAQCLRTFANPGNPIIAGRSRPP